MKRTADRYDERACKITFDPVTTDVHLVKKENKIIRRKKKNTYDGK